MWLNFRITETENHFAYTLAHFFLGKQNFRNIQFVLESLLQIRIFQDLTDTSNLFSKLIKNKHFNFIRGKQMKFD